MKELVQISSPMEVTFHRAFDRTRNPFEALEIIIECGCKRILTSGQYPSLMNSLSLIKQLMIQANDRIIIMPGSGLKSENVQQVLEVTNAKEIHTAARKAIFQESVFSPESMDEQMKYISVDALEINKILATLNSIK
jgi:copper homeostasis protein